VLASDAKLPLDRLAHQAVPGMPASRTPRLAAAQRGARGAAWTQPVPIPSASAVCPTVAGQRLRRARVVTREAGRLAYANSSGSPWVSSGRGQGVTGGSPTRRGIENTVNRRNARKAYLSFHGVD